MERAWEEWMEASRKCGGILLKLIVEDDAEERGVNLQAAIVFDEAELAEFVHEEIDAGAGGADHFCERFLGDFGEDALRPVFGAVACEEQERAGEAFFAGVEELVNEIF